MEAGEEGIERFALYPAVPGSQPVWGFFGEAPVQGRNLSVMGNVVDDFFDQPRVPPAQQRQAAGWMREQAEEFALDGNRSGARLAAVVERARKSPGLGRFPVSRQFHEPDVNFGFINDAVLREGVLPVAGVTQDQLYDFPRASPTSTAGCRSTRRFSPRSPPARRSSTSSSSIRR